MICLSYFVMLCDDMIYFLKLHLLCYICYDKVIFYVRWNYAICYSMLYDIMLCYIIFYDVKIEKIYVRMCNFIIKL